MKCRWILLFALFFAGATALGGYNIDWFTIDGGGGRSSGGSYVLTGTIGQPDADSSRAGNYKLVGGFWGGGGSCIVEFRDYAIFADYWLLGDLTGDLNSDAAVNFIDLQQLAEFWLRGCQYDWPLK
jgi:hypothetical protein